MYDVKRASNHMFSLWIDALSVNLFSTRQNASFCLQADFDSNVACKRRVFSVNSPRI